MDETTQDAERWWMDTLCGAMHTCVVVELEPTESGVFLPVAHGDEQRLVIVGTVDDLHQLHNTTPYSTGRNGRQTDGWMDGSVVGLCQIG